MPKESLFRQEVLSNKRNHNFGTVSINTPFQYTVLIIGFSLLSLFMILFVMFAEFSEKWVVTGYLNSAEGVARVYASKNGVISSSKVYQGMHVKRGDELFVIDTSYQGLAGNTQQNFLAALQTRKRQIIEELHYKKSQLRALQPLLKKNYLSQSTYHGKQEEINALQNSKSLLDMEIIKYYQDNAYVVRAPLDGIVSTVNFHTGQAANMTKPLVKILPVNAQLIAELFIPVRQSGFLKVGNRVVIRYDAYPYERFGSYGARVQTISQTIMTDDEDDKPNPLGQPYYKVSVQLDSQFVKLYGQEKPIQHGMTLTAVIVGEKRKVWQWILDPLYSFYGELLR